MTVKVRINQINPSLLDHNYIERIGRVRAIRKIFEREYNEGSVHFREGTPAFLRDLEEGNPPTNG